MVTVLRVGNAVGDGEAIFRHVMKRKRVRIIRCDVEEEEGAGMKWNGALEEEEVFL